MEHKTRSLRTATALGFAIVATVVSGCAAPSTKLQNASGQVVDCSAWGMGVLGASAALLSQHDCVDRMQAQGYREMGAVPMPQTGPTSGGLSVASSNIQVALPAGWDRKPLTSAMQNGGILYAQNPTIDGAIFVRAVARNSIGDFKTFVESRRAAQVSGLTNAQASEIAELDINGRPALRYTVTGRVGNGMLVTYLTTFIAGKDQIAVVNTWTSQANFAAQTERLAHLSSLVGGM
jgi:hypothetical protein